MNGVQNSTKVALLRDPTRTAWLGLGGLCLALALACSGGPEQSPVKAPKLPSETALEPDEGGPGLACPEGTVQRVDRARDDGLVMWGCAYLKRRKVRWRGPVRFFRDGREVVRGRRDRGHRVGTWQVLGEDGSMVVRGDYDMEGFPTGTWVFPIGERTWQDGRFEPLDPWAHLGSGGSPASRWDVEALDADLSTGAVALRVVVERECSECISVPEPCRYPGLDSPIAGVQLRLANAGGVPDAASWTVYAANHADAPCTPEPDAIQALAAAKAAFANAGLDPSKRVPWVAARITDEQNGLGSGAWAFDVEGHRVALVQSTRPGADVELTVPGLADRDWTYDSTDVRVFFYDLRVDGVAVFRFLFTTYPSCIGGGHLRPEGLLVDGDRAMLVISGVQTNCSGAAWRTQVSPVFSLSDPVPWAW